MNDTIKNTGSIESTRLEIERRRLVLEEWRVKQEQRFTNKYLAIILTSAISLAGVMVAFSNVKVAQVARDREIEITKDQHKKTLDLELSKLLSQNSEKINGDEVQRNLLRTMIITAFSDKANRIFEALSNAATGDNRQYWRSQGNLFAVATKGDTNRDLVAGAIKNVPAKISPPTLPDDGSGAKKVAEEQKIEPRVKEKLLKKVNGTEIYNFSLWLNIPENKKGQIKDVTYIFNHPSFGRYNRRSSTNEGDGFHAGYEGWGAIDDVTININFKDGTKDTRRLNMIKALGW